MASGMRLITYDSDVTLKSGPQGCSVIAAPPTTGRDSSTVVRSPALARNAAGDQAVVAAADDHRIPLNRSTSWLSIVPLPD